MRLLALFLCLAAVACVKPAPKIANAASLNCTEVGGRLIMKSKPGGAYGVCYFEDNRQCEEWALFRGQCPVGGLKITGYLTEPARYCTITGGDYRITVEAKGDQPQRGTCTLPDGHVCDANAYYAGSCPSG